MRSNALITCTVAGIQYLLHPQKQGAIDAIIDPDALVPVTLLTTSQIFDGDVDSLLKLYDIYDDVFIPEFGAVLVEKTPANSTARQLISSVHEHLFRFANHTTTTELEKLESGPYFLYGPNLYQAWRLYEDELGAFVTGIIPEDVDSPHRFRPLTSLDEAGRHKAVGVPSKLMFPPPAVAGPGKPLSGVRIAVTDAASINGVPRTMSSRAWSVMHPERAVTSADFARRLVSMGAVVVGKTKTSQFTASQDWIDVATPFTPRGDQYRRPNGSSAGASASIAGYPWVSHTIYDDDRGDSLPLATQDGYFSFRPSPNSLTSQGSKLASSLFSTLSISARLLDQLLSSAQALINSKHSSGGTWTHIVRFTDFEAEVDGEEKPLYEEFVQALEDSLGVKSQPINLTKEWEESSLHLRAGLSKSLNEMCFLAFCHQFYHGFAGFRDEYQKKFKHMPFTEPTIKRLWDIGANSTEKELEEAENAIGGFRYWFQKRFFHAGEKLAIISPAHPPSTVYRDEPLPASPARLDLLKSNRLAAVLGLPVLTAPFAQLPFVSRITDDQEFRPVSASVIGCPGCDVDLIELVQKTYHLAKWRARVDTGRLTFPLAKTPRNVDDRYFQPDSDSRLQTHPNYPNCETNPRSTKDYASDSVLESGRSGEL